MRRNIQNLWEEFSAPLRGFIRKRVAKEQDVEDILQEVFLKIHASMGSLREEEKIQAWIYGIARNTIIDHYRKDPGNREVLVLPTDPELELAREPEEDLSTNKEIAACLKVMVEELPEKYRQAILLTEFGDLTQAELGRKLGISLSGAKSRVQRGRKMLKTTLLACCQVETDGKGNVVDYRHKDKNCKYC
ncbi:RNA polymerase sigma factor SigZ [Anaerotalea alkaliphila]|uniref:RNA polymerase sigma factor SigZ n=1 Tax=Anaerotalea alkaliphila TaxID=2662126 RepID=A0A7X5HVT3_9FIRM|nr:RNA polymerase sigma factor SigZ [Anaerotalea alkaliphila]NDL67570.1 RNA polymerase sigma factor SigZ [Anaerotalea alkaliphila]